MLYLIHFSRPFKHAKHYLGFCKEGGLESRLKYHRAGRGSKLLAAVARAGITFEVVKTWPDGTRTMERELKKRRYNSRLCPVCNHARNIKAPTFNAPEPAPEEVPL